MIYDLIFWDWNGTLLDDVAHCLTCINGLLSARSLPPLDETRYRSIFDFPVRDYYRAIGFDFDQESFDDLAVAFMAAYDAGEGQCGLYPNAASVLAALAARGVRQAVLSASEQRRVVGQVAQRGLASAFDAVLGTGNISGDGKMGVARAYLAATDHRRALLIGDTLHDAHVARDLGIDCALVTFGHQSPARLAASGVPLLGALADVENFVFQN